MPPTASARHPLPTVLLRHVLPDGSWHLDWMLGRDPEGRETLVTFRLPRPLDDLAPGQVMTAEPIGSHRSAYLEYEGPVSGDRGYVTRLDRGDITSWDEREGWWTLRIRWSSSLEGEAIGYRLEPIEAGHWQVQLSP